MPLTLDEQTLLEKAEELVRKVITPNAAAGLGLTGFVDGSTEMLLERICTVMRPPAGAA